MFEGRQGFRPHRAHAGSRHEPYAFLLGLAVDKFNAVVYCGAIECGRGVFRDEVEELVAPRSPINAKRCSEGLQLLEADCVDGRRNGFAPGFVDFLNVNGLEWHDVVSVGGSCSAVKVGGRVSNDPLRWLMSVEPPRPCESGMRASARSSGRT